MTSLTISAPAKINLFLKILNKRKDGYHNILTLFERISLADEITISKIPSGVKFKSDKFITADPKDNLVCKAAGLVLKYIRPDKGLKGVGINLKKNIPVAAGLGGGSSDAGAVLIGINKLYGLKLKTAGLVRLAKKLGADVPFFVLETPFAAGRGIGDKLEKVNSKTILWHVLVCPGPKPSTKEMYEAFDASTQGLTTDFTDDKIIRVLKRSVDFNTAESMLYNNLEEIVISKKPVTGTILERLASSTGRRSIVAGSGPSVFCLCTSRKEAMAGRSKFLGGIPARDRKGWQVFIAKTEQI